MAIVIDPGEGALARAIGSLGNVGEALVRGKFHKEFREQEIKQNPAMLTALAPAIRQAQAANTLPQLAESLGVRPEFLITTEAGFRPGAEEIETTTDIELGGPQLRAQAGVSEAGARIPTADVQRLTADELIAQGGPQAIAFNEVRTNVLQGMTSDEAINANQPQLAAMAAAAGAQFEANNFEYQDQLLNFRRSEGVDEASIRFENMKNVLGMGATQAAMDWFDSLPEGRQRTEFALAMTSPAVIQHIQFHENLDFQGALAQFEASGKAIEDRMSLTLRLNEAWQTVVDRTVEAQDLGRGAENAQIRETAARNLESMRLLIEDANTNGLIYPIDTAQATVEGRRSKIELEQRIFEPNTLGFLREQGISSVDDFRLLSNTESAEILADMDQRMLENFTASLERYSEELEAIERERPKPETVIGRTVRETGRGLGLTDPRTPIGLGVNAIQWWVRWSGRVENDIKDILDTALLPVEPTVQAPVR